MSNADDDQGPTLATGPGKAYALSGKIMLSAIVVLFGVVVFLVGLHLYARWYLVRLRRRQLERRRHRRSGLAHVILYADSRVHGDRGLELAVVNSLPYFFYTSKPDQQQPLECAVCLSEFEEKEIVRLLPKCDHIFHLDCIDMWFQSHSTCPLCRSKVEFVEEELVTAKLPDDDGADVFGQGTDCGSGVACATCQKENGSGEGAKTTTPLGGRGKGLGSVGVRIEVPPRRVELEGEAMSVSSPSSRLLYLKRILSMGKRSPVTPSAPGPSRVPEEVDLESGSNEATPAQT